MASRVLKVRISGAVTPADAPGQVAPGDYMATEIKREAVTGDLRAQPIPTWRLRRLDDDGRPLPAGPVFVLTFPQLAAYIEAKHMRVVEGDFV
ncbi:MAG TPA: hypothetical protein VJ890_19290 [Vineibacter sp.]|nr:hypothetical protein [Vineibacter sp.]